MTHTHSNPPPHFAVTVTDVQKSFIIGEGLFYALQGINLQIQSGEFLGLVGPSGSGKTTLLNLIGGLDKPSHGDIHIDGIDLKNQSVNHLADIRNRHIGFIFQSYNLLPVYTAHENIEFPLLLQGHISAGDRRKLVEQSLDMVGLSEKGNKYPSTLSGGECQRVAIARAIVKKPSLVLADEPTANLDAKNSHAILKIMKEINDRLKTTFIFSTHDEKVMGYLKRIIRLQDGSITEDKRI